MKELWVQVQENLSFVIASTVIVVAMALLARLGERFLPQQRQVSPARRVSIVGICSAIAMILYMLDFPLVFLAPEFYKLDFSEVPVLLCGFLCGCSWGAVVGFTAPLLRNLLFGMPPMPGCISMAFELAAYGLVVGLLHKKLGKGIKGVYLSLICAMVAGRLVWGVVQMIVMGLNGGSFPFSAFVAGAVTSAIPGIVLQLVLLPVLVKALDKAKVTV